MTCDFARELMLEADLSDLAGTGQPELAQHLEICVACRARAERILHESRSLADAVSAMRPKRPLTRAQEQAERVAQVLAAKQRKWRRIGVAAPIAIAAGVGGLLLWGNGNGHQYATPPTTGVSRIADFDVEAPPGTSVAVFGTDNPKIVVIWYF